MPYPNMPKSTWARMEKCVADVKAKDGGKNAYAICYSSIMGPRREILKKSIEKSKKK